MKLTDIAAKNDAELMSFITDERTKLAEAVRDIRTKDVKNVKIQAGHKRSIARALTIQRQRALTTTTEEVQS